ncbi:hypothetical protein PISL3812_01937 [Talaromyces islandicus]|uniref:Uncharacterized protein n=1 Tax=Talaromyces islandicus TaxID=28573 RepID=A0A0U1LQ87_TALIS|nr:hypothetical protein PISL3812_01937 [Talaromyces islandicus]
MHFAVIPLALSFLALTTSVVTAPVATEGDHVSAHSVVDDVGKRAYYYYSGPEKPADVEKRAYYYYAGPEQPAEEE